MDPFSNFSIIFLNVLIILWFYNSSKKTSTYVITSNFEQFVFFVLGWGMVNGLDVEGWDMDTFADLGKFLF